MSSKLARAGMKAKGSQFGRMGESGEGVSCPKDVVAAPGEAGLAAGCGGFFWVDLTAAALMIIFVSFVFDGGEGVVLVDV